MVATTKSTINLPHSLVRSPYNTFAMSIWQWTDFSVPLIGPIDALRSLGHRDSR